MGGDVFSAAGAKVRIERHNDSVVVAASGELDVNSAPCLRAALNKVVEYNPARVVVDLSDVEFLDSTGLGVLLAAQRRYSPDYSRLLTIVVTAPNVLNAFKLTGLDRRLDVKHRYPPEG